MPLYDRFLKGKESDWDQRPPVEYFVRGANVFKSSDTWPPVFDPVRRVLTFTTATLEKDLEIANGDSPVTDMLWTHYYAPDKIGQDTLWHSEKHPSTLILPVHG